MECDSLIREGGEGFFGVNEKAVHCPERGKVQSIEVNETVIH